MLIPPSIPMILRGVSAEVSIGELFIAGFGPSFLRDFPFGGALMSYVFLPCRKKGWGKLDGDGKLPAISARADLAIIGGGIARLVLGNKVIGPTSFGKNLSAQAPNRFTDLMGVSMFTAYFVVFSLIAKFRASLNGGAAYALMTPMIVLGGLYGGVFTPTEASAAAVVYALFVGGVVSREIGFRDLLPIFRTSGWC